MLYLSLLLTVPTFWILRFCGGRFDRQIVVDIPDEGAREFSKCILNIPLSPDVELNTIARGTPVL